MRTARLKVPADRPIGFYHCLSRVVDRRFIFHETEKERFVTLMRECERFCRVRVLTFCVMSNHFHLLVEIPRRPETLPGPEEILAELGRLSGHQCPEAVRQRFNLYRSAGDDAGLARYLATFHARMYDVSAFMKLLKQRFTQWYNRRQGRKGTLWEERFRSVLVDGAGQALVTMAAYIELNPVRARIVRDPKDYRWCGYGEAMAGRKRARDGVQAIVTTLHRGYPAGSKRSLEVYRQHLHLRGDERRESVGSDGRTHRGAFTAEEVARVLTEKGKLPTGEYLRCRVRYFCDGAIFGGREFVEDMFRVHRRKFGRKRKSGARMMKGLADQQLFTLRALRVAVFGNSSREPVSHSTPAASGRDPQRPETTPTRGATSSAVLPRRPGRELPIIGTPKPGNAPPNRPSPAHRQTATDDTAS